MNREPHSFRKKWGQNFLVDPNIIKKIYSVIKKNFLITKRVIQIKYINSFPKNSSGKILYKKLYD